MYLLDLFISYLDSVILPVFCDLHWLPIRYRINFKIMLLTFKAIHGLAPKYIRDLVAIKSSAYNLRSADSLFLSVPLIKTKKTLGDREILWQRSGKHFQVFAAKKNHRRSVRQAIWSVKAYLYLSWQLLEQQMIEIALQQLAAVRKSFKKYYLSYN